MKLLTVFLDVVSRTLTLDELSSLIGQAPSEGSHDKGEPRGGGKGSWSHTIWRLTSREPESAPLAQHCESILSRASEMNLAFDTLSTDAEAYLNVAVIFDTPMCSFRLEARHLQKIYDLNIGLEVSCYPSSPEPGTT